jgi:hypothetical protein
MKKKFWSSCILLLVMVFMVAAGGCGGGETNPDNPDVPDAPSSDTWDGTVDTSWYSPNQAEFIISTAEQLAGVAKLVNDGIDNFYGKTITLAVNIDLAGGKWTPIGDSDTHPFAGRVDGGRGAIMNMVIESSSSFNVGLFGTSEGTLLDIHLTNISISASSPSGSDYSYAGGLVGQNGGTITDCEISGSISFSSSVGNISAAGGLVGFNKGTIEDSTTSVNVSISSATSSTRAGGFVGQNSGTIRGCEASGNVAASSVADSAIAGGFGGANDIGTITNCIASGREISATSDILAERGGFLGGTYRGTFTGNRNNTGVSPAIGGDGRIGGPSDDI